jgi:hypothetical protein
MARPRKLEAVKELSGAYKKNPKRRPARADELKIAAGLGPPPSEWVEGAKHNQRFVDLVRTWGQIVDQDVLRVLNRSHRMLIENHCYLMYKIRRASAGLGKATSGDYAQAKANLSAIGQTPIDSMRVAEAVRVPDRGGSGAASAGRPGSSWGEYVG